MIAEWIEAHELLIGWLLVGSVVSFVGTLIIVPLVVVELPGEYFARRDQRQLPWAHHHPVVRIALLVVKNILATAFIIVGIAMLVLPGQGILTILVGLLLLDFPGKYAAERWLISRPWVLHAVNRVRVRFGKPPFVVD